MERSATIPIICEPDPEHPGWLTWTVADESRFNGHAIGKLIARAEDDGKVRVRMFPGIQHANMQDTLHGAAVLALADVALFATAQIGNGVNAGGSVTLDLTCQFIGSGGLVAPVDAVSEILRETGRLIFLRGLVEQEGRLLASFTATVRKPTQR